MTSIMMHICSQMVTFVQTKFTKSKAAHKNPALWQGTLLPPYLQLRAFSFSPWAWQTLGTCPLRAPAHAWAWGRGTWRLCCPSYAARRKRKTCTFIIVVATRVLTTVFFFLPLWMILALWPGICTVTEVTDGSFLPGLC